MGSMAVLNYQRVIHLSDSDSENYGTDHIVGILACAASKQPLSLSLG